MSTQPIAAITGAAGHLGEALVRQLLERGWSVRALTRSSQGSLPALDVELVQANLLEPKSLEKAFEGAEVVFNLAALISLHGDPNGKVWQTNVDGAHNVANAALKTGVRRLVHCSSIQAFSPKPDDTPISETRLRSLDPGLPVYDRSKAEGELRVLDVGGQGLEVVICNPTSVVGPWDFRPSRSGQLLLALARNQVPALPPGAQNWVDVRDIASGMRAAAEQGIPGANYILGGHTLSLRTLGTLAADEIGARQPLPCPMGLAMVGVKVADFISRVSGRDLLVSSEAMQALTLRTHVCLERAERELGYHPRPMEDTIKDTYRFFRTQGWLPQKTEALDG